MMRLCRMRKARARLLRMRNAHQMLLLLAGLLAATHSWALLSASVDRAAMLSNETLRLTITSDQQQVQLDAGDAQALAQDFDIVSQSTKSAMQFVNGQISRQFDTVLTLAPKRTGELVIPAFRYGNETAPSMTIIVKDAAELMAQGSDSVTVVHRAEAVVDVEQAYVQGQAVLTVRITSPNLLVDLDMSPLAIKDVRIEKLKDRNVQHQDPDTLQVYYEYEVRYALFSQFSGTLNIPALTLDAVFSKDNQFTQVWGSFRQQNLERKRLRTAPISVEVLAKPAHLPVAVKNRWLPAKSVVLSEQWSQPPETLRLGDAVTRKMVIAATGAPAEQLPAFEMESYSALKVYEEADDSRNQQSGADLLGVREVTLSYVPTQAGTYVLPPVRVPWWNIQTQTLETAELPEQRIVVDGNAQIVTAVDADSAGAGGSDGASADNSDSNAAEQTQADAQADQQSHYALMLVWLKSYATRLVLLGASLLASILFGLWLMRSRRGRALRARYANQRQQRAEVKLALQQLQQACQRDEPRAARDALLAWARQYVPSVRSIDDVNVLTTSMDKNTQRETKEALHALNSALYAPPTSANAAWHGAQLVSVVEQLNKVLSRQHSRKQQQSPSLPQLYMKR